MEAKPLSLRWSYLVTSDPLVHYRDNSRNEILEFKELLTKERQLKYVTRIVE